MRERERVLHLVASGALARGKAVAVVLIALIAGSLAGCTAGTDTVRAGEPSSPDTPRRLVLIEGIGPVSVAELSNEADLVVTGRFGQRAVPTSHARSFGGEAAGPPIERWTFTVDEVIEGAGAAPGESIEVTQFTAEAHGAVRPAVEGARALLFLGPSAGRQVYDIVGLGAGAAYLDGEGELEAPRGVDPALEREVAETSRDELKAVIADAFD